MGFVGLLLAVEEAVCAVFKGLFAERIFESSGRIEGTDAHIMAVPTSATDQLIELTLESMQTTSGQSKLITNIYAGEGEID